MESTIFVRYLDRNWQVCRYQWSGGTAALLLRNPETGGVLPASLEVTRLPGSPNEAHVPDADGLVAALENAGVVKATEVSGRWMGMNVRKCVVVHPELVRPECRAPHREPGKERERA
jgi:hypothetical protein